MKVFKPSHNLPTITLESQGVYEMKLAERLRKSQEKDGKEKKENKEEDLDENQNEREARYMDDWRDEHPRGYGNSKLRPCAQ